MKSFNVLLSMDIFSSLSVANSQLLESDHLKIMNLGRELVNYAPKLLER